jgi:hypothetical protein
MRSEFNQKFSPELVEMNEKLRKDLMRTLEPHGGKPISDLPSMSEAERAKWYFWNLHENLDEFRKYEPALIGQVMCTQLTLIDGQSMETVKAESGKRISLHCKWTLRLVYSALQNEEAFPIGDGSVDLLISNTPPTSPSLQKNQKGYLDADSSLFPNQLVLYGWINEGIWDEVRTHLYSASPTCHTDIMLRDNYVFPVKSGFDFVVGPPGSLGITNIEFRVAYYSGERRTARRNEGLQR